jgi:hypothetical protein
VIGITFIWLSHPNLNQFSLTRMPRPETMKLVGIENLISSAQIFGVYIDLSSQEITKESQYITILQSLE